MFCLQRVRSGIASVAVTDVDHLAIGTASAHRYIATSACVVEIAGSLAGPELVGAAEKLAASGENAGCTCHFEPKSVQFRAVF